jgi:hypothetical protein
MKEKLIQFLSNQPENYNKSATRYLYKKEPELWKWILESTSFLPDDAKPKQRCWHILNDNFIRPVCPVTGKFTKWNENRYLEYISLSAKAKSAKVTAKRLSTYKEKTGYNHWNSAENTAGYEKRKKTCFDNWGGVWPNETDEIYDKFIATKSANGFCRTDDEKSSLELYNEKVKEHTKNSWYYSYSRINPDGLERGKEYHLDHIYSRKEGFDNNVPPEVIGHWTNLRLLPAKLNNGKSAGCDKTIEKLYEDYYNNGK